jgi:hypothetical protein
MLFAYADLESEPTNGSEWSLNESLADPLVTYPFAMGRELIALGQIELTYAGLGQAIAAEKPSDSTVNELTVVNQSIIAEGSFATDRLDDLLTEATDETWGIVYEQTETINGYEQYEAVTVPDSFQRDPPAIAVTDETVVVSASVDQLGRMIAAGDGTQSRIYETNETVTQLLEEVGTGEIVVGKVGSLPDDGFLREEISGIDPQFAPRSTETAVTALEFAEDGSSVESRFALAGDELTESRQDTIKGTFGTAATDDTDSVEVSGDRITASGTYSAEKLGLPGSGGSGDEGLSQAAAAELISPDALAFQYDPPRDQQFGEFWVTVTEDADAAAVRLETDSGSSTEIRPQEESIDADDSVAVPVEPDGDSVTVFAVDDEGAAGELATQSVPTDELSEQAASQVVPEDALSFSYEPPRGGDFGSLRVEVVADTAVETLIAQPQEALRLFTDRVGSVGSDEPVAVGTTLETAVDPDDGEVIVYATVEGATGEVARWQKP